MTMQYNDPGTTESSVGTQIRTDHYKKKALIELVKEKYFSQHADVTAMPKNMGKKIKRYHWMPLLDDRNINDQGIDAAGATILTTEYGVQAPRLINQPAVIEAAEASFTAAHSDGDIIYIVDSTQWLILTADTAIGYDASVTGGASGTELSDATVAGYLTADTAGGAHTVAGAVITLTQIDLVFDTQAEAVTATLVVAGSVATQRSGNLYGSSKDVGTITGKLPVLSETGGSVNRVGFKRLEIEGTIEKFGFYDEYTKESVDFDTEADKQMHVNREMLRGANEMTEDMLQIDLLNSAGVVRFSGVATDDDEMTGVTADGISEVTFDDFSRLAISLDNNRCPKSTKIITGSRMVDTQTINASRIMYIGSEMKPTIERLTDHFSNQAFIEAKHYAQAGNLINGEWGSVGEFRIVVVPEMMHWAGAGAAEGVNAGYRATNGKYDVFPMLTIGFESFTTIGFETSGNMVKFKIKHAEPESPESYANDPFGETGFMSIKWYYGFMALRTERLALIKSVARQ